MGSLGLEAVLISHIGDGDQLAIGGGVRVGSSGHHGVLVWGNVLQGASLLRLDAISGLVGVFVASVKVHLLLLSQNRDGLGGRLLLGSGRSQSDEGGDHLLGEFLD